VLAQPYWWDEQWTISVQHTEADIDKHLAIFEEVAPALGEPSRSAAAHSSAPPDTRSVCRGAGFSPGFRTFHPSALPRRETTGEKKLANEATTQLQRSRQERRSAPRLGRWDPCSLFLWSPSSISTSFLPSPPTGGVTVWLWIISLALFFWPQGIAVIELAHRYPAKAASTSGPRSLRDFHGFLSGWCYWTNNMMYVPTIMLYFVGSSSLFWELGMNR